MKKKVKFAIMQYVPNFERDEKINVGVILHCTSEKFMKILLIENFKRLKEFDDELDINFIKVYFKSIEKAFTYNYLNINNINIDDCNLLEKLTYVYINQFTFKIFDEIDIEIECEEFLLQLKNNYLYLDIKKENRISQKDSVKFFESLLRGRKINYEIISNKNSLLGNFNEKINVDFKIGNKFYKIINFNDENIDRYTPTIKMWMMNSIELREKGEELIFVINDQVIEEKSNTFINMLNKYGKVVKFSEFDKYF